MLPDSILFLFLFFSIPFIFSVFPPLFVHSFLKTVKKIKIKMLKTTNNYGLPPKVVVVVGGGGGGGGGKSELKTNN